jgi:hypothetical protein
MGDNKINITSTAVEKGIDLAKDFLGKLIMPAVEEVGLLVKDQVTMWRFNNQIKMLTKSKAYCEKKSIAPKTISLKLLCPLLDYSGLEEDEQLQDKWAILLGNMVDSEQNVENHVFPYVLSQISKNEFDAVEQTYRSKKSRINQITIELNQFLADKPLMQNQLEKELEELTTKLKDFSISDFSNRKWQEGANIREKKNKVERELSDIKYKEMRYRNKLATPEELVAKTLQEYEIANLIRLGLVKEVREAYAHSQTLEIPNDPNNSHFVVDLDIDVESNDSFILTELGDLFIEACTEKSIDNGSH